MRVCTCVAHWYSRRLCPKDHGFDSRSSRHDGTLGKSLTHDGLWRFGVKLRCHEITYPPVLTARNNLSPRINWSGTGGISYYIYTVQNDPPLAINSQVHGTIKNACN